MIDYGAFPHRDKLLERVYTSLPVFKDAVVNSNVIPTAPVTTESSIGYDFTSPVFEIDGRWKVGTEVQTFYKGEGGEFTLRAYWYAFKDYLKKIHTDNDMPKSMVNLIENQVVSDLKRMIVLSKEKQLHDLLTTTSNYASGFSTTPSTKWDDPTADIVADIQAGISKLSDVGLKPDTLILPYSVWTKIKFAPSFKNVYVDRNYATPAFLKDLFEIPNIIMPAFTTYGKPKKKSAYNPQNLWGDDVIIMTTQPLGKGTYPFVVKALLSDAIVQRFPIDGETMSQKVIAREAVGYNMIHNNAGYLIKDVLS